jgi:hypothetical protein
MPVLAHIALHGLSEVLFLAKTALIIAARIGVVALVAYPLLI